MEIREKKRIERAADIQKRLSWMSKSNELITDINLYLINAGMTLSSTLIGEMDSADYEKIEYARNSESTVLTEDSKLMVFSMLSKEWDIDALRLMCQTEINTYEMGRLIWGSISDDKTEAKILYVNGSPFISRNIDLDEVPGEISLFCEELRSTDAADSVETANLGEDEYLCIMTELAKYDIVIASLHSYGKIIFENRSIMKFIPIFAAIFLLVAILFLLYFNGFIEKPIIILCDVFKDIVSGHAHIIHTRSTGDEFNRLYKGFNEMNLLLREKTEQVYLKEIEMQRSKFKQLQAQIDPHFLYNSLFIVKAKIWNKDYKGAMRIIELLAEYFQFLNRNTKDFVPLQEELNHAYVYANIQSTRFARRFEIQWEKCPPECRNVIIPRLVIQPLIENPIKYGFDNIEENGLLKLNFEKEENRLEIIIEGSGTDMSDEKIGDMNKN